MAAAASASLTISALDLVDLIDDALDDGAGDVAVITNTSWNTTPECLPARRCLFSYVSIITKSVAGSYIPDFL